MKILGQSVPDNCQKSIIVSLKKFTHRKNEAIETIMTDFYKVLLERSLFHWLKSFLEETSFILLGLSVSKCKQKMMIYLSKTIVEVRRVVLKL